MARSGINRALVQKARDALLARGEHPSIDAIRVELGNTGSKSTIHRCLKELEGRGVALPSEPGMPISERLSQVVAKLAEALEEEATESVADERAELARDRLEWQQRLQDSEQRVSQAHAQNSELSACLAEKQQANDQLREQLQQRELELARALQASQDLQVRLEDRDGQIRSLEEKHQHARDALEHYRQASKEQREQDQRRHETQLQQVQMELRQSQQSLMVKQDELTRLHRDNERLLTEAAQLRREQERLTAELPALQGRLTQAETSAQVLQVRLETAQQEIKKMETARTEDAERLRQAQADLSRSAGSTPELYRALAIRPDDCRPLLEAVLPLAMDVSQRLRQAFDSDAVRLRAERECERYLKDCLETLLPCQADGDQRSAWLVEGCVGAALHGGAFSIALLRDGKPMLALVMAPGEADCIAWASGLEGLLRNGAPLAPTLARLRLEKGAQVLADRAEERLRQWSAPAELTLVPHPAYRLARVAAGDGVCALGSQSVSQKSLRAALALLKAAGGVLLDPRGQLIEPGRDTLDGFWAGASNACALLVERSRQVRLR